MQRLSLFLQCMFSAVDYLHLFKTGFSDAAKNSCWVSVIHTRTLAVYTLLLVMAILLFEFVETPTHLSCVLHHINTIVEGSRCTLSWIFGDKQFPPQNEVDCSHLCHQMSARTALQFHTPCSLFCFFTTVLSLLDEGIKALEHSFGCFFFWKARQPNHSCSCCLCLASLSQCP